MFRVVTLIGLVAGCESKTTDSGSEPETNTVVEGNGLCETAFYYETDTAPDGVLLAGEFNDWSTDEYMLEEWADGQWGSSGPIPPGVYA